MKKVFVFVIILIVLLVSVVPVVSADGDPNNAVAEHCKIFRDTNPTAFEIAFGTLALGGCVNFLRTADVVTCKYLENLGFKNLGQCINSES